MATIHEVFLKCLEGHKEIMNGNGKEYWYYNDGFIYAIVKPFGSNYECFIIQARTVYSFILNTGESDFIHATVRYNNMTIKISGPRSIMLFCTPQNLSTMKLVSLKGHVRTDEEYWKEFFVKY